MSEIKFKIEWLDLLFMCAADDDSNIQRVLMAIKQSALDGTRPDMESDEIYYLPEGVKYALNLIVDGILAEQTETAIRRKNLSEKRAEAGRKSASKRQQVLTSANKCQQNGTKGNKEERDKEKEKDQKKEITEKEESTDASVANTYSNIASVLAPSLSCPELVETTSEPALITLPLNDGSEWPVTTEMVTEWSSLYPAVDVMQELRNMRGWCLSKPKNRKTPRGVRAFITTWLSKEQDRGPKPTARSGTTQRRLTASEIAALPFVDPFAEIRGTQ